MSHLPRSAAHRKGFYIPAEGPVFLFADNADQDPSAVLARRVEDVSRVYVLLLFGIKA